MKTKPKFHLAQSTPADCFSRRSDVITDLGGSVYSANLDGKNERSFLYVQGNFAGIANAEI